MKLLFDENLPATLAERLSVEYPRSQSVAGVGLAQRPDAEIVTYAKHHGYIIATKDVHFYRHCVAHGHPPKVIWVRTGNCSMATLVETFQRALDRMAPFELNDEPYLILK